jgi:plasmid maintenance system antidote protein VapI
MRLQATPELVRTVRASGRRQNWLAERLGISQSSMTRVVKGERTLPPHLAGRLADLVDGDLGALFEIANDGRKVSKRSNGHVGA